MKPAINNFVSICTATLFCTTIVMLFGASSARADSVSAYGVFGNHAVIGASPLNTSGMQPSLPIGSNGDVFLMGGQSLPALRGGGSLVSVGGTIRGNVTFNNNVFVSQSNSITGNVDAGGDATLLTNVLGNIVAGGTVTNSLSGSIVSGSITAGGAASVISVSGNVSAAGDVSVSSTVQGGVVFGPGKALNLGPQAHINGSISSGPVVPHPAHFDAVSLPGIHDFSAGNNPPVANMQGRIEPGSYSHLLISNPAPVTLTAGSYFFSDIKTTGGSSFINLDTTHGPINIFVTGSVNLAGTTFALNHNASPFDSSVSQIYLETHDAFTADSSSVIGTVYAPFGNIDILRQSNVFGPLISGHDVFLNSTGILNFLGVSPMLAVPEPSSLALAIVASMALLPCISRRWRRARPV